MQVDVIQTVSPEDSMWNEAPDVYFPLGEEAVRRVELAISAVRRPIIARILDFGCGHGRVLRYLKAEFPRARLVACDIDHGAVDFCAETFGARPVYGHFDPERIRLRKQFDLIWCGSLFTHLDAPRWDEFLRRLCSLLVPYGMLVFTTAGRSGANRIRRGESAAWWFPAEAVPNYDATGFSFAEYPDESGYGQSMCSLEWVLGKLDPFPLRVAMASEDAWGGQDVVAAMRLPD